MPLEDKRNIIDRGYRREKKGKQAGLGEKAERNRSLRRRGGWLRKSGLKRGSSTS